ncbi:glycoside hydrolase [Herbiconiux sp. 11R-BC]|uniref:RICIN domain-containing protein n=1 Tax=Herbiconiux sp. 11R-BC TaxID=3111637 RepID=UPI003C0BA2B8
MSAAALTGGLGGFTSAPASAATGTPVTITPNPAYQNDAFEGWGTSLVWFANATGDYPPAVRQELFDKVFGEDGLNLNIARYNIGGGNASDVPPYLRQGAAVDGWWNPDLAATDSQGPITSNYADRDRYAAAWRADDPASYDFTADQTQRWWVSQLKDKITKWEAFSNSPPYFMTQSGFVSGGTNSSADQLKTSSIADYVTYLKTVVQSVEAQEGISFDSIDPFNEPNTNYWGTNIDSATGWPKQGGQEGAHMGPALQDQVIKALSAELAKDSTTTDAIISAMDETNPSIFATDWNGWSAEAKSEVSQLNVHTYGTSGRTVARDIAKTAGKDLWMSEIEGDWDGSGVNNQTNINNGLGVAARITDDLRELEPSAWVLWQPVEDAYNMQKVEKLNWGSVQIDFDCNADGNSVRRLADHDADPSCKVQTNAKYNTIRNFTHYIHPGDHIIPSTNTQTTTAVTADGTGVTLVHANPDSTARTITVDLSKFGTIAPGATLTPIVTTESPADDVTKNALVQGASVRVDAASKSAVVTVPAKSVSTFVISGVSGVADTAAPLVDGHKYQIVGSQSGKTLTPNTAVATGATPGATINATTLGNAASQLWTVKQLTGGGTNHERYVLTSANGKVLAATSAGVVLRDQTAEQAAADASSQWILTTTNGSSWSLVNGALPKALEVPGQATAEGSPVNVYDSNNGANQAWSFRDTALTGFAPVSVNTIAGIAPTLPGTVVPQYRSGAGAATAVTWNTEGIDWNQAGTVTVQGSGTDLFGTAFTNATATVEVGGFTTTDPVSVTSYAGVPLSALAASAPTTVPARIGASSTSYPAAVTWDWSGVTDASFASTGVVTVTGSAVSNDPAAAPLAAKLSVILTTPVSTNIAPDATTTATATSTESGYPVDRTRNRVIDDKGWSNWRSTNKPLSDTLSYNLGSTKVVDHVMLYFYKDGSTLSWPDALSVEYQTPAGAWVPATATPIVVATPSDGKAPVVDVDLGGVQATQVRAVLTAKANTHMVVSEVEVYAKAAGVSTEASLAALSADGASIAGFDAAQGSYSVAVAGSRLPVVAAVAVDTAARVSVVQATDAAPTATVTVTAADGTTVKEYSVTFSRTVVLQTPTVSGVAKAGQTLTAAAVTDPADAQLAFVWTRDGAAIDGATTGSYLLGAADVAHSVAVTVTASAPSGAVGYTASQPASSEGVVVQAADVDPGNPGGNPGEPGGNPGNGGDPGGNPGTPGSSTFAFTDASGAAVIDGAVVKPGQTVTANIREATAGAQIAFEFHSDVVQLASGTVAADGSLALSGVVPADATAGTHHLVLTMGGTELASVAVVVEAGGVTAVPVADAAGSGSGNGGSLPQTGADGILLLLVALGALAAIAGGALVIRRRRVG